MSASKENSIDLDVPSVSTTQSEPVDTNSEVSLEISIPQEPKEVSESHELKPAVEHLETETVEFKAEDAPETEIIVSSDAEPLVSPEVEALVSSEVEAIVPSDAETLVSSEVEALVSSDAVTLVLPEVEAIVSSDAVTLVLPEVEAIVSSDAESVASEPAVQPKPKRSHKAKPVATHPEAEPVETKAENAPETGAMVSPEAQPKPKRSHKAKPVVKPPEAEPVETKAENAPETGAMVSPEAQPKPKRSHQAKPVVTHPEAEPVEAKSENAPETGSIVSPDGEPAASVPAAPPKPKRSHKAKPVAKHPEAESMDANAENAPETGSIVSPDGEPAASVSATPPKPKRSHKAKPVVTPPEAEPVETKDAPVPEANAKPSHKAKPANVDPEAKPEAKDKKEKKVDLSLEPVSKKGIVSKSIVVKNESTRPIHGLAAPAKASIGADDSDQKTGVRRKGPIGSKSKKVVKTSKSEFGMRMCVRCPNPFEPVEENEVVCPKCKDAVNMRFSQLFGDEDPYSPQPTLRTNKIARVIFRNSKKTEAPEPFDRDIAEESLEPIDRYDDE